MTTSWIDAVEADRTVATPRAVMLPSSGADQRDDVLTDDERARACSPPAPPARWGPSIEIDL
jgi:hypothetical protein